MGKQVSQSSPSVWTGPDATYLLVDFGIIGGSFFLVLILILFLEPFCGLHCWLFHWME